MSSALRKVWRQLESKSSGWATTRRRNRSRAIIFGQYVN